MKKEIRIHATGGRFDLLNGYPPAGLANLAAWERLLRAIVRERYRSVHGTDASLPAALDAAMVCSIDHLQGGGSADVVFALHVDDQSQFAEFYANVTKAAADLLASLSAEDATTAACLSSSSISQPVIGVQSGLVDDETLQLHLPADDGWRDVSLNTRTLQRARSLSRRDPGPNERERWCCGRIDGITRQPWTVGFKEQGSARTTSLMCDGDTWEEALSAFHDAAIVRLRVTAVPDGTSHRTAERVLEMRRVPGPDFERRLRTLSELPEDWAAIDGGSSAPKPTLLRRVRSSIWQVLQRSDKSSPHLFPTEDGGVDVQWRDERYTWILQFAARSNRITPLRIDRVETRSTTGKSTADVHEAVRWLWESAS